MDLVFQFALGLAGAIFGAGVSWATFKFRIAKLERDGNNIAKIGRDDKANQERRWLFEIADTVEEAETEQRRIRLAARIRHEAFRK